MKLFYKLFLTIFVAATLAVSADDFSIQFNGFVKTDYMFDTRQSLAPREGHFYLWPLPELLDAEGEDINAKPNFNILSVQTRLHTKITGPEVWGAKTSGYIEMEFFGSTDANINTLRLRHGFIDLDWETTKLRAGQFWHPLFATDCYAGTISFNTGVPFQPFSRNPQLMFVKKFGGLDLKLAAVSQRDFSSPGPNGFSSQYLRNSIVPELFAGLQYKSENFVIGAGGSFKSLTPQLSTSGTEGKVYKSEEKVSSYAANAYTKITNDLFSFKLYGVYGQNLPDVMLPGGYAVKTFDAATGEATYTPFNNMSVWTDIAYGKKVEVGLFGAFGQVLGTADETELQLFYGRGTNINSLYRVSPRIAYTNGKFRTAFELEYTAAEYGINDITDNNKISDGTTVANIRGLFAFYLFF